MQSWPSSSAWHDPASAIKSGAVSRLVSLLFVCPRVGWVGSFYSAVDWSKVVRGIAGGWLPTPRCCGLVPGSLHKAVTQDSTQRGTGLRE